jgi:hypothetical protein
MARNAVLALAITAFSVLFVAPATAQEPPGMLATDKYLFVVRGGWVYQFDVDTLALRRKARFPKAPAVMWNTPKVGVEVVEAEPKDGPAAVAEDVQVDEVEVDEAQLGGAGGRYGARGGAKSPGKAGGAIEAGLNWLARHQDETGRWDADGFMKHDTEGEPCDGPGNAIHDVGVTGLAMLAMLGDGSTLRSGPHRENLKRAARWLRNQQQENGLFGTNASHDFIYDHAIATYAMCEAYGLSNYTLLKNCAQQALNYLESHRNPYSVWRYQPRDNDNDTSVTSWCLMALKSGEFFNLEVNPNALELGLTFLDQVSSPDGRHGYTKQGEGSSRMPGQHATAFPIDKTETLTAAALFCRFFLGQSPKDKPVMKAAADLMLKKPPKWSEKGGSIDHYYWYYGTYAMYQMGGKHWRSWSKRMLPAVLGNQRHKGHAGGSWDPVGVWGESGGRIYSTALMVLTLQSYYRYARLVR